jgi:hypothetical protein
LPISTPISFGCNGNGAIILPTQLFQPKDQSMFLRRLLYNLDEEAAAEEDEQKIVDACEIGASLAFPELPPDADIAAMAAHVRYKLVRPEDYYGPDSLPVELQKAQLDGQWLRFPSALPSSVPENDMVFARVFESQKSSKAIVIVPYWNSSEDALMPLAKILCFRRMSALGQSSPAGRVETPFAVPDFEHSSSLSF